MTVNKKICIVVEQQSLAAQSGYNGYSVYTELYTGSV